MNKFSQDDYLKKRIKEIYKGRPCNLCVMNGELFKRDSSGNLTQIFTDPDFYLDKIQEKILNDEERRDRKKIIAIKKALFKGAVITGAGIAFLAWFSMASKVSKKGDDNRRQRFDTSYVDPDYTHYIDRSR